MADDHFRSSLVSCYSSIVPNTVMGLLLTLSACDNQWPSAVSSSLECVCTHAWTLFWIVRISPYWTDSTLRKFH